MAVITFWNDTCEQTGNTSSAVALATQIAIEHNIKILLISTSLNNSLMKDSFWKERKSSLLGIFGQNNKGDINRSGIDGLDRALRSNKMSPDIITDYANILLTNRLEVLLGVEGSNEQYQLIKNTYVQILAYAKKYYDMVIVDLDKKIGEQTQIDILKASDLVIAMIPQRAKEIKKVQKRIEKLDILSEQNTILTIGKYLENTKYNAKNITRNILGKRGIINTIPYNSLFFEATQEGRVIDLFIDFMRLKDKDENYQMIVELKRLYKTIKTKLEIMQLNNIQ